MPIRICHVIAGLSVGGAETVLLRLILSQPDSTYHHSVVALTPGGAMRPQFDAAGIPVVELNFSRAPLGSFFRLIRLLRKSRPAIVHTWLYHADLIGGIAARLAGVGPVVWCVHSTDFTSTRWSRTVLLRRLCAFISGAVPRAVVYVARSAQELHVRLGYRVRRSAVIPNGFSCQQAPPLPEIVRLRPPGPAAIVGWVGRYSPDKDIPCFLNALQLLAGAEPNFAVVMVGSGLDKTNAALIAAIKERSLERHISLLGLRPDVASCLASFNIFCLSSRSEAFPLVLGEAMAAGLPCVSTDVGDVRLLLGDTGLIVPPEDPAALASALGEMLALPGFARSELGARAAARIRSEYSLASTSRQYRSLYVELLGSTS